MPIWSEKRAVSLLSRKELAELWQVDPATITRWLRKPGVYKETLAEPRRGPQRIFYDPYTIRENVPKNHPLLAKVDDAHKSELCAGTDQENAHNSDYRAGGNKSQKDPFFEAKDVQKTAKNEHQSAHNSLSRPGRNNQKGKLADLAPIGPIDVRKNDAHQSVSSLRTINLEEAKRRLCAIRPILATQPLSEERRKAISRTARKLGYSDRYIYRWVQRYEGDGLEGLLPSKRGWKPGRPRMPEELYTRVRELVVSAFATNGPTLTDAACSRIIRRVHPEIFELKQGSKNVVSISTIRRMRADLESDPVTHLLFKDASARKEFLRVWSGSVLVSHANAMWQLDMTRCDVMVVDPANPRRKIYRPRIQAIVDVYSGCVPGLSFSDQENQAQADLATRRALFPKQGPFSGEFPVWGTPKLMYIDNGKIYCSKHFESYMERLGVQVVHSKPRVSHTRGHIERFFGSLHQMHERMLPGYCGPDARHRDSEALRKLYDNTQKWLDAGADLGSADPWAGERFLTIDEYQASVAVFLMREYHQMELRGTGKTRLEHFVETVPKDTLIERTFEEMIWLMGRRETRKLINGEFQFRNMRYWIPSGELALYPNGADVIVVHDEIVMPPDRVFVAVENGAILQPLGLALPAPKDALSEDAQTARKVKKAKRKQVMEMFKQLSNEALNPNLRHVNSLMPDGASLNELAEHSAQVQRLKSALPELTDAELAAIGATPGLDIDEDPPVPDRPQPSFLEEEGDMDFSGLSAAEIVDAIAERYGRKGF